MVSKQENVRHPCCWNLQLQRIVMLGYSSQQFPIPCSGFCFQHDMWTLGLQVFIFNNFTSVYVTSHNEGYARERKCSLPCITLSIIACIRQVMHRSGLFLLCTYKDESPARYIMLLSKKLQYPCHTERLTSFSLCGDTQLNKGD